MKRWIALGLVLCILIAAGCLLTRTAVDPADYTGDWYCVEDGRLYRFREGVISCLLQNPDGYSWVAGQLSPEDFLLEGDGEIYAAICEKLREGKTPDMTLLGAVLPEKRLARLVEIMARDSYQGTDKRQAADCIQCLLAYRNKKTKDELGKMGDEDYGRYISSMIAHKK